MLLRARHPEELGVGLEEVARLFPIVPAPIFLLLELERVASRVADCCVLPDIISCRARQVSFELLDDFLGKG